MRIELARHEWWTLRAVSVNSGSLARWLPELTSSTDESLVEVRHEQISAVVADAGRLTEAALPVAICLVQGLWRGTEESLTKVLDLLTEIATGDVGTDYLDVYGSVSRADLQREVARGFPVYCEILESDAPADAKVSCIDLIHISAAQDSSLLTRAIFHLRAALRMPELGAATDFVSGLLDHLEKQADVGKPR